MYRIRCHISPHIFHIFPRMYTTESVNIFSSQDVQNQMPYFPRYLPYFSPLWTCDGWWLRSSGRRLMGLDSGETLDYCSHWLHHVASKISIIAGHCQPGMLCYCLCHRLWKSASAATRWRFYQQQIRCRCRWMVDALVDVTGSHGRHDCIQKVWLKPFWMWILFSANICFGKFRVLSMLDSVW